MIDLLLATFSGIAVGVICGYCSAKDCMEKEVREIKSKIKEREQNIETQIEHWNIVLKDKRVEIDSLRGLISQGCHDCTHKKYCKNTEKYDSSWMLGCKNWADKEG